MSGVHTVNQSLRSSNFLRYGQGTAKIRLLGTAVKAFKEFIMIIIKVITINVNPRVTKVTLKSSIIRYYH